MHKQSIYEVDLYMERVGNFAYYVNIHSHKYPLHKRSKYEVDSFMEKGG